MLCFIGVILTVACSFQTILPANGYGTPHLVPGISHETSAAEVQEWAWTTMLMLYNLSFPGEPPSGWFFICTIVSNKAR